jgi:putative transposase
MCSTFKISRSGFYNWNKGKSCRRVLENKEITKKILLIYNESKQRYGSPMITKALKRESVKVSRPRVARLMKKANIQSKRNKKFVVTTNSNHSYPIVSNLLNRNFQSAMLGKVWVSDITYVPTCQGWLYLTTVMDLADRKIIGWALSQTMKASHTSIAAFNMAVKNRPILGEVILHSDRGIQYACTEFKCHVESKRNILRSMSRKGDCWDNAVAESFFKTFKCDLVYGRKFNTIQEAKREIFEYIEIWYNRKRMHSSLGYRTPQEMEEYLLSKKVAA